MDIPHDTVAPILKCNENGLIRETVFLEGDNLVVFY